MPTNALIRTFVNQEEQRIRAGWRILGFAVLFMGLNLLVQAGLKSAYGGIPQTSDYLRMALVGVMAAFSATVAVPLARRYLDRKSFASLGLLPNRRAIADLLFGFGLSFAMIGLFFVIVAATGLIEVSGINWGGTTNLGGDMPAPDNAIAVVNVGSLLIMLLVFGAVGWWEELVFRGYLLQNMIEGMGVVPAGAVSCLFFGAIHLVKPDATLLAAASIVLLAFMSLYAYLRTRSLWLPIGMHIGWNFCQDPIFGFSAADHPTSTLVAQRATGPDWLSGGTYGPEASVILIPIVLLGILAIHRWSRPKAATSD